MSARGSSCAITGSVAPTVTSPLAASTARAPATAATVIGSPRATAAAPPTTGSKVSRMAVVVASVRVCAQVTTRNAAAVAIAPR